MKSKLGEFSNANALLVGFELTHKELITAQAIAPDAFVLMDKEGKNQIFRLFTTSDACATQKGVSFPFINENEDRKVEVIFFIPGGDTETIRYNAASIVTRLKAVEVQIKAALKAMKQTADTIETFSFGSDK